MNNSYQQEDRKVLLIDYIYRVLSQWRSIIVAMVVCAVAFGGLKYFKDTKDLKAQLQVQENIDPEEQLDAMMSQLTEKEKDAVERVIHFEKTKAEREDYIKTAAVMKLDRSEVDEMILQYHVEDGEDAKNTAELLNAYKSNFLTDDVMKKISEISDNMEAKDVKTMITATSDARNDLHIRNNSTFIIADNSLCESLFITVRGFSKDEVMNVSEIIKKAVSDYSKKAQGTYGKHRISLANDKYQKCEDEYVGDIQEDVYNRVYDLQYKIDTMMTTFSENQNYIVEFYVANIDKKENFVINNSSSENVFLNVKWILGGFFFGACVIAGFQFVIWLLGGQVNSPEELIENYAVYNFGIYEDKDRLNTRKLFSNIDSLICHICYRNRLKLDREEAFDVILSSIVEKCKTGNVNRVYLANVGNINISTETFIEQLIDGTKYKDIVLMKGDYPCANANELSRMIECGSVIFCDNIENMKRNDYIRLLQMCEEYNVNVMGTVFIV